MKQKISASDQKLMQMLRQKQEKLNIHYLKTDSTVYRVCRVLFYIQSAICTLINLAYLLGVSGRLNANLSAAEGLSDYQSGQAADIKSSLYSVGIMGALLLIGAVFMAIRKPIAQLIFTLFPGGILLWVYSSRLSEAISGGSFGSFVWKHLLPIGLLILFSLITGIIHIRQRLLDRRGCLEISERIYRQYAVMADHITPEQWEEILREYKPEESRSKKRSVKRRAQKHREKDQREQEKTEV